jgi:hypothetical protein
MGVINDPMLALIARLVVEDIDDPGTPRRGVPAATGRTLPQRMAKKELSRIVLDRRCADCPLVHRSTNKACCTTPQPPGFPLEGIPGRAGQFG